MCFPQVRAQHTGVCSPVSAHSWPLPSAGAVRDLCPHSAVPLGDRLQGVRPDQEALWEQRSHRHRHPPGQPEAATERPTETETLVWC